MREYNKKKMVQSLLLASSFLVITAFSGCSDSNEDKTAQKESVNSSQTPVIEIVQNENAQEIKVQEKKKTELELKNGKAYYYDYNVKSAYDENSMPANKDASVRSKPRTPIEANMNVRSPYEKVEVSLMVRKMSKKFIVKCSACHNDYANGIIGPSLLGKDVDYIFNKIADFKSGKKSNPLMDDLINMMSDTEIKEMAQEIYKFNEEIQNMRNR
ncbi:MAG: hypothetical protein U9Q40_04060 [Campylobacterota bacterium]|nr:hypothetical protein [Campylobacterota bacterium]